MRISKLYLPAVTVAGALALAGCGGGSSTPGAPPPPPTPLEVEQGKESTPQSDGYIYECPATASEPCKVEDIKDLATEYEDAGFTRRKAPGPALPPSDEKLSRLLGAVRSGANDSDGYASDGGSFARAVSRGTVTFAANAFDKDGEITASFRPDTNNPFTPQAGSAVTVTLKETGTAAAVSGWNGKKYGGTAGGRDEDDDRYTAVVYDNKGAPTKTPFKAWTELPANTEVTLVPAADGVPAYVAGGPSAAGFGSTKITGFTGTARGNVHSVASNTKPLSVPGTLNGAAGTFRCAADRCTSRDRPTGDNWRFFPAANAMVETPDADYVRFGWWLQTENPADEWANIATFAGGTGETAATAATVVNTWEGKATYKGGAAGFVAISRGSGNVGNIAGEFAANATLEADFGSGGESGETGTMTGTIDGFTVDGRSQGWVVKLLKSGAFSGADEFGKAEDGTTWAWTEDADPADADGAWRGNFHNEVATDDPDLPESVAGTFRAQYENIGFMQGAFGADEDPAN